MLALRWPVRPCSMFRLPKIFSVRHRSLSNDERRTANQLRFRWQSATKRYGGALNEGRQGERGGRRRGERDGKRQSEGDRPGGSG